VTERHPLTEKLVRRLEDRTYDRHAHSEEIWEETIEDLDKTVRDHCAPLTLLTESGVAFPNQAPTAQVAVEATFIEPGNQMQMALIGSEPVLLLQPQYDAETNSITLVLTAVALDPIALEQVVGIVADASQEMASVQRKQQAEMAEADAALRKANEDFELAQLPETPEG